MARDLDASGTFDTGESFYYHADHQGSVVFLTDESGAVANEYTYDAYGQPLTLSESVSNPYLYTAREFDPESGLYHYRARAYDPETGRFLQEDPIGFLSDDLNLYRYVGNNPANWTDPDGLFLQREAGKQAGKYTTKGALWLCSKNASCLTNANNAYRKFRDWLDNRDDSEEDQSSGDGTESEPGSSAENDPTDQKNDENGGSQGGSCTIGGSGGNGGNGGGSDTSPPPDDGGKKPKRPIWTPNPSQDRSPVENAYDHWDDHGDEFPEYDNALEYVKGAHDFLDNPPEGSMTKTRTNGDTIVYDPGKNTFAVQNAHGAPRTMFKPNAGIDYFLKQ